MYFKCMHAAVLVCVGTLLLDGEHQGQLFVKQVWVSDQRSDGLSAGVNFKRCVAVLTQLTSNGVVVSLSLLTCTIEYTDHKVIAL